jgi:hypothetical protein
MRRTVALVTLVCSACGPREGDPPPAGQVRIHAEEWRFGMDEDLVVLVLDDAPTPDAANLRQAVVTAFGSEVGRLLGTERTCGSPVSDPAGWPVVHSPVVIVHPSAPLEERWTTPTDDPALDFRSNGWSDDGTALTDAVARGLSAPLAATGTPYSLLESVRATLDILGGRVAPGNVAEQRLADAQPARLIELVVATTRDDESPLAVTAYSAPQVDGLQVSTTVVAPGTQPTPGFCESDAASVTGRIGEWLRSSGRPSTLAWPCDAPITDSFALFGIVDCGALCWGAPIIVDAGGTAECRILAVGDTSEPCDPARGWIDPAGDDGSRRSTLETDDLGTVHRLCEIQQLTGDALANCRTSRECPDCGSGWCRTDLTGLGWDDSDCPSPGVVPHLRFVGGALAGARASVRISCALTHEE